MAKKERIFAGFGAALFLVTSSALTIGVIMTLSSSSNNNQTTNITNSAPTSNKSTNSNSIAAQYFKDGTVVPGYKPQTSPLSNLEVADVTKGTGTTVKPGATVKVDYVGFLADSGQVFDTSAAHGGPVSLQLKQGSLITGWVEGIPGMKVGGTRELLIPAAMGYGSQKVNSIPPNSDLGFYVQVDSVQNP